MSHFTTSETELVSQGKTDYQIQQAGQQLTYREVILISPLSLGSSLTRYATKTNKKPDVGSRGSPHQVFTH